MNYRLNLVHRPDVHANDFKNIVFFLQVPESYTFIQVIDLAFKASKVFNIGFHKYVAPLFRVFEEYVYGMENGPMLTPKHLEDANLLFEKS